MQHVNRQSCKFSVTSLKRYPISMPHTHMPAVKRKGKRRDSKPSKKGVSEEIIFP